MPISVTIVEYSRLIIIGCYAGLSIFAYNLYYIVMYGKHVYRSPESGGLDYRLLIPFAILMIIIWIKMIYAFSLKLKIKNYTIVVQVLHGLANRQYKLSDISKIEGKSGRYSSGLEITFRDNWKISVSSYARNFEEFRELVAGDMP
jgi:hypothetical protein